MLGACRPTDRARAKRLAPSANRLLSTLTRRATAANRDGWINPARGDFDTSLLAGGLPGPVYRIAFSASERSSGET